MHNYFPNIDHFDITYDFTELINMYLKIFELVTVVQPYSDDSCWSKSGRVVFNLFKVVTLGRYWLQRISNLPLSLSLPRSKDQRSGTGKKTGTLNLFHGSWTETLVLTLVTGPELTVPFETGVRTFDSGLIL